MPELWVHLSEIASKCLDVFELETENWWAVSTNHTRWELPIIVAHACFNSKQPRTKGKQTLWLHKGISLSTSSSLASFLPSFFFGSVSPSLFLSVAPSECHAFLFVCSYWAFPADPQLDFPKADINITGHCDGVIFMEAPAEVTWLWWVPRGPGVSIKPVVLTSISINEVENPRKQRSLWDGWRVFWAPISLMGPEYFPSRSFSGRW